MEITELYDGISRARLGTPESATPVTLRFRAPHGTGLAALPAPPDCPLDLSQVKGTASTRGFVLDIPLTVDEELYGFGLQFRSFRQRAKGQVGTKKTLRTNSDPVVDTGDSHAPVPFYVSTRGYGVLVDTARYATFYCGSAKTPSREYSQGRSADSQAAQSAEFLYMSLGAISDSSDEWAVKVDIPHARGADLYLFWGDDLRQAVQRYNLFSGGGCEPPAWGLGVWYRVRADFDAPQVEAFAKGLRDDKMPCDVIGLEPGWQTQSYPCSFLWSEKFPEPQATLERLKQRGFRTNIWTHVFTHRSSPIYDELRVLAGDHTGFGGLVPDLSLEKTRTIFASQHEKEHIEKGVSGYKLDECDNSDFIHFPWSFPELTQFPSGLDGEQMHSLIGLFYQETIDAIFRRRDQRAYHLVRAAQALAAPYPFVLYSDLYDHREFIRALCNAGFCGLLWTPEVREAKSAEDLVRRLQSAVCSPQALINGWYIKNAPWKQWDIARNNADELAENHGEVEALCREVLELRMKLIPYLSAAFARYQRDGLPPFRALVMDFPDDENVRAIDDQYMMGESFLVAPMVAGESARNVYLPRGDWHDFWSGEKFAGETTREYSLPLNRFPLFVKSGAILPMAQVSQHVDEAAARHLKVRVYGDGSLPCELVEEDGVSFSGAKNTLQFFWDDAKNSGSAKRDGDSDFPYEIVSWEKIGA